MKQYKKIILTVGLLVISLVSMGATYVWTPTITVNPNEYDWSNANNWRVGGVVSGTPGTTDAVSILTVSTVQKINLPSTSFTVASLTMSTTVGGAINFSASAAVTITTTGLVNISSTSIASTGTPGFGSDRFITYNVGTVLTITNTKINFALKTNSGNANINGSTFAAAYELVATPTSNSSSGGNTYNGDFIVENKATFNLIMGATNPDKYYGNVAIKHTVGDIYMSYNSINNIYAKPVTFYSATAGGIYFGYGGGTSTFNGTSCLMSSAGYMTAGGLNLRNITKTSTTASSIVIDAAGLSFGPSNNIAGDFNVTANSINLNGGSNPGGATCNTFENYVNLIYTGTVNYSSGGGNYFKKKLKITNNVSTANASTISFGSTYDDRVDGSLTIINTGALRTIILGSVKNFDQRDSVFVNNTNTGSIKFGDKSTTGVFLFAKDKKVFVGTDGGVTNGFINFSSLNQTQPTDNTITGFLFDLKIPNGTCASIQVEDLSVFRSRVEFEAPEILIAGGQFYNYTTFTALDGCTIPRTFNPTLGSYIIRHSHFYKDLTCNVKNTIQVNPTTAFYISGDFVNTNETLTVDGDLILEQLTINSRPITICSNGTVKANIGGSLKVRHGGGNNNIVVAANGQVTVNGDIFISKGISGGTGLIYLGSNTVSSLFTHNGVNVSIEPTKTFLTGGIVFNNFKQTNSTTYGEISLIMPTPATNTTSVSFANNSDFKSKVIVNTNYVSINQSNFFREVVLNSWNAGSYINGVVNFASDVNFTHNITGTTNLIINATFASNITFNGNLTLTATNAGGVINTGSTASNVTITNFYKNITYTNTLNTTVPTFYGITNFLGTTDQYINYTSPSINIRDVNINKPSGKLYVQKDIAIIANANFTNGIVVVPLTNLAIFNSGSAVLTQSEASFIDGRVKKFGNVAFTFPTGKGNIYAPIGITAPCNTAVGIVAQYFPVAHPSVLTVAQASSVKDVSNCQYWKIDNTTTPVCSLSVILYWRKGSCQPINKTIMTGAKFASSVWTDAGNIATSDDSQQGAVTTASVSNYAGEYTLGYQTANVLNTQNAYPATFKFTGSNIDFYNDGSLSDKIFTSGSAGSAAGATTKLAYLNNVPGKVVFHPAKNQCSQLDILSNSSPNYIPLSTCIQTDVNGVVSGMNTGSNAVSSDYYSLTGSELFIYSNKKPDGTISITNNLMDGIIWKKTSNPTLSFSIGGNVFGYAYLYIKNSSTGAVVRDATISFTGNTLNWTGPTITTDGLYVYELRLGITAGDAKTYTGSIVVKMYE